MEASVENPEIEQPGSGSRGFPTAFPGRSLELRQSLSGHDAAGDFFEAALRILADEMNPAQLRIAAYTCRELIAELQKSANTISLGPKLGERVDGLKTSWEKVERNADGSLVNCGDAFLDELVEFFEGDAKTREKRETQTRITLQGLDPVGREGPPEVEDTRVDEMLKFHSEFAQLLHGSERLDLPGFEALFERFERFLLNWLRPDTFADQEELDTLIQEGPPG